MTEKLTTEKLLIDHKLMLDDAIEENNKRPSLITRSEVGRLLRLVAKLQYAL